MSAHELVLLLHSYVRWAVLGLGVAVVVDGLRHRRSGEWSARSERLHKSFLAALDSQLVLGLVLYLVLSPITRAFFASPGASMKVRELRFFGIEHITVMIVSVLVAHVGRVRSKRAPDGPTRHRRVFGWTLTSLVLMLTSVPWPFMPVSRPLLRAPPSGVASSASPAAAPCPPVFATRCASCHGTDGRGDGPLAGGLQPRPRSFAEQGWARAVSDEHVRSVIRDGGAAHGLSPLMPPHPDLAEGDVDALARCVRAFSERP